MWIGTGGTYRLRPMIIFIVEEGAESLGDRCHVKRGAGLGRNNRWGEDTEGQCDLSSFVEKLGGRVGAGVGKSTYRHNGDGLVFPGDLVVDVKGTVDVHLGFRSGRFLRGLLKLHVDKGPAVT